MDLPESLESFCKQAELGWIFWKVVWLSVDVLYIAVVSIRITFILNCFTLVLCLNCSAICSICPLSHNWRKMQNMHWCISFWRSFWHRGWMHTWIFKGQIRLCWKAMVTIHFCCIQISGSWPNLYIDLIVSLISALNGLGLVHEDCIAKMRLMSLVDLASVETGQISYSLIKDTLRVKIPSPAIYPQLLPCALVPYANARFFCRSMMMRWKCGLSRQSRLS